MSIKRFSALRASGLVMTCALLVGAAVAVTSSADPEPDAPTGPVPVAMTGVEGEVLQIGDTEKSYRQIDLYLDFIDPGSAAFVQTFGEQIGQRVQERKLVVNLCLVSPLDPYSASGSYSSRALIAAFLVAAQSGTAETAWKFVRQLFDPAVQPKEDALKDLTDQQLATLAEQVGAPAETVDLIASGNDRQNVDSHRVHMRNIGRLRTSGPTVMPPLVSYRGYVLVPEESWLDTLMATSTTSTATGDPVDPGGVTGVNVPHQEVTPGAPITKPTETLAPAATPQPSGEAPASEAAPAEPTE